MSDAYIVGERFAKTLSQDPDLRDRLQQRVAAVASLIDWSDEERDEWLRITGRPLPHMFDLDEWLRLASLAGVSPDVLLLQQDQLTVAALVPIVKGALERLRLDTASRPTEQPAASPTRWTAETANPAVMEYLAKHATRGGGKIAIRQISDDTGISKTTIGRTAAWKAYQRRWTEENPPRQKDQRHLGGRAASVPDDRQDELERLISEQQQDAASSRYGRRARL